MPLTARISHSRSSAVRISTDPAEYRSFSPFRNFTESKLDFFKKLSKQESLLDLIKKQLNHNK